MQLSGSVHRTPRSLTTRCVPFNGARLRVLVVDDNQNAAHALAAYLSLEDMECCTAFSGREAIAIAMAWAPHLILVDISMLECDGFEIARALRHDPRTCSIAIVAHTALDESEFRRHLTNDEFDGYLQKGRRLGQMTVLL